MFETFRLSEFNEDQIQEYVKKWFAVEERDTPTKQRQNKINAFLEESRVVPDLRSNPLMLSLLCTIYRVENYIPRNRPDIYKTCADMLFERWDKRRNLYRPPDLLEEHMRPLMEYLAQWIYQDEVLRKGVTEGELTTKATEYLYEWVFEASPKQKYKAERTAEEFVQFCTGGRAWVFSDTGTKKEGEKLYQFTHATFLEYFTASYFVSTNPTPDALAMVLITRIERREWDVMAQLAFQIQSKRISGAADELLMLLVNARTSKDHNEINLLSFVVRCLSFMTPRPIVLRCIANAWAEYILTLKYPISSRSHASITESNFQEKESNEEIFRALLSLSSNNQEIIIDCLNEFLIKSIHSEDETAIFKAIEICTYIVIIYSPKLLSDKEEISAQIIEICKERLLEFASKNIDICLDAKMLKVIDISKMIEWHGIDSIFYSRRLRLFNMSFTSLYTSFMISILDPRKDDLETVNTFNDLKELGQIVLYLPMPCFKMTGELAEYKYIRSMFIRSVRNNKIRQFDELESWEPGVWFGAIIVLAIFFEDKKSSLLEDNIKHSHPIWKSVGKVFQARVEQVPSDQVQAELDKCGFSQDHQRFIWSWIRQEINLIQAEIKKQ